MISKRILVATINSKSAAVGKKSVFSNLSYLQQDEFQ